MHNVSRAVLGVAAMIALSAGVLQQPNDGKVVLRAVRSYRGEHRTQVDAFLQVPYGWLEPTEDVAGGRLSYRIAVRVTDSTGLTLLKETWRNHAVASVRLPDAFGMQMIHFSVAPGRYRLIVDVEDSVSGQTASSDLEFEGFSAAPAASDLLLSPQIRLATADDSVPRPAELRWGQMLVTAAARLQLTPLRPRAFYLLEAYSPEAASGTLEMQVMDSLGKSVVRTSPTPVQLAAGGGLLRGQLDLAGLAPGRYSMKAVLNMGTEPIERSAGFVMGEVGESLEREVARRDADRLSDEGYFATMNENSLDAAKGPLETIAESGELASWSKSLSVNAKRNFLGRFWASRDPTPNTPRNEAREAFYQKVDFANRSYGEVDRTSAAGWRSARGRIYLRNGLPDDVLRQGSHGEGGRGQSRALAYEVWRYTSSGKDRYYIFVDRTGLGAYALVRSNDLKESGMSNWYEFFGRQDLDDIERFVGRDLFR